MSATRLLTFAAAFCVLLAAVPAAVAAEESDRPNIVVISMDDVSPHDGRLWGEGASGDPSLTPTLYDRFVANGVKFTNAIGETPLCCPGRAGLLTGRHTHNHGVLDNDAKLFDPEMHIGTAMTNAGYTTMYIGKYFNQSDDLTEADWVRHGAGWTHLDAINAVNGKFYNYELHTKSGPVKYTTTHSTQMVANRAVMRFRDAPSESPLFAVLSVYNLHAPNTVMPQFVSDTRCDSMPPWKPPNFNELDVSDKHPYIQNQPLLPYEDGWPMTGYCREMLGIDWLLRSVVDELEAEGRLENTLFVLTADNGMAWGAHRLGQRKLTPYATPIPLYMSWPGRWGDAPRKISDVVSNIDVAPTLCAFAQGCTLGPYPDGQTQPDGVSLLPLLDDPSIEALGRDALLETAFNDIRTWQGLRTTPSNPRGLWHYVEWADGFRELYNLATDPDEMTNVASDPALSDLRLELSERLAELFQEGRVGPGPRPDGAIALVSNGTYKGAGLYSSVPRGQQMVKRRSVQLSTEYRYFVRLFNRGTSWQSFRLIGSTMGTDTMSVRFVVGGSDVTTEVMAGTYTTSLIAPLERLSLTIRINVGASAPDGAKMVADLYVRSAAAATLVDVVRAVAVR